MATDSIRWWWWWGACLLCLRPSPPRWRHYNPHSWPRSSIEYCTQICAYIVLDISMISPHLSPGSGLEPWLCMCIYSQRTFVIQFRFVVSSIFKLFQTTLDPASVCEYECECVRVCMSSIPYLAVYLSVFICRFVCLAVVFNCIQILFLLVVWCEEHKRQQSGGSGGRGGGRGEILRHWSFQQLLQ